MTSGALVDRGVAAAYLSTLVLVVAAIVTIVGTGLITLILTDSGKESPEAGRRRLLIAGFILLGSLTALVVPMKILYLLAQHDVPASDLASATTFALISLGFGLIEGFGIFALARNKREGMKAQAERWKLISQFVDAAE